MEHGDRIGTERQAADNQGHPCRLGLDQSLGDADFTLWKMIRFVINEIMEVTVTGIEPGDMDLQITRSRDESANQINSKGQGDETGAAGHGLVS